MSFLDAPEPDRPLVEPHETSFISVPPQPTLRQLFFGDDGLRAGWSFLLFVIIFGLFIAAGNKLLQASPLMPPAPAKGTQLVSQELTPRIAALPEAMGLAALTLASLLMSLIERRPFTCYGISLRLMLPDLLAGGFWGFAALSGLVGALLLTHGMAFDGIVLHGSSALRFGFKWAVVFLLVGLFEEYFTRGYMQYTVARGVAGITRTMDPANRYSHPIGFWVAAFLFSVCLFVVGHLGNSGENATGIVAVALAGITFAFSLYRTGTLWWAIGMHASWDWAQSFFYGTPDSGNLAAGHLLATHPIGSRVLSGGPDGPEGSILVIPTLLALLLVIHVTLPRRAYPLTPDQSRPTQLPAPIYTHSSE